MDSRLCWLGLLAGLFRLLALPVSVVYVHGQSINGIDDICFCRVYGSVNKSTLVFGGNLEVRLEAREEEGPCPAAITCTYSWTPASPERNRTLFRFISDGNSSSALERRKFCFSVQGEDFLARVGFPLINQ
jgi:hypothetical protein